MRARIALLLLLPMIAGCGVASGTVSGRVMFDGKPLPGGLVTFRPADSKQNSVTVELNEQGSYRVNLPAGVVHICVDNRELEPRAPIDSAVPPGISPEMKKKLGGDKAPSSDDGTRRTSSRYVAIPMRYYTVETAELSVTVKGGDQTHDIELTK